MTSCHTRGISGYRTTMSHSGAAAGYQAILVSRYGFTDRARKDAPCHPAAWPGDPVLR